MYINIINLFKSWWNDEIDVKCNFTPFSDVKVVL